MRIVLAGVSDALASGLRSQNEQLERPRSAADALRTLRRPPTPRLLVVSETFPGAGDVLAAVDADWCLANVMLVLVVGDRSALAMALRKRGVPVFARRGACKMISRFLRSAKPPLEQAFDRLIESWRVQAAAARSNARKSKRMLQTPGPPWR